MTRDVDRRRRREHADEDAAPPADARHPLLALQRHAGNQAVRRLLASSRPARPALQRMQLVATSPGVVENDAVVLMNMRQARDVNKKRGVDVDKERIASLGDDYSGEELDFEHREVVFLHGHGLAGVYRDEFKLKAGDGDDLITYAQAADVIAGNLKRVTSEAKRNKPYEIRILTCHGGDPRQQASTLVPGGMPSLVTSLQAKLAHAPNRITIKGFVEAAFSYPGYKTHQEPAGFQDTGYTEVLKPRFDQFNEWLKGPGAGASYAQRLAKIEELIPAQVVTEFMTRIRGQGAYSKEDASADEKPDRRETFIKVVTGTT